MFLAQMIFKYGWMLGRRETLHEISKTKSLETKWQEADPKMIQLLRSC